MAYSIKINLGISGQLKIYGVRYGQVVWGNPELNVAKETQEHTWNIYSPPRAGEEESNQFRSINKVNINIDVCAKQNVTIDINGMTTVLSIISFAYRNAYYRKTVLLNCRIRSRLGPVCRRPRSGDRPEAPVRVPDLRHRPRRIHFERRTLWGQISLMLLDCHLQSLQSCCFWVRVPCS